MMSSGDSKEKIKFDRETLLKHPAQTDKKVEGYWADSLEESKKPGAFPWPAEHKTEFPGKAEFLKKLKEIEASLEKTGGSHYQGSLGWSDCRCCKKMNGTAEYSMNNVNWPQGYSHYIETHNVVPSKEFYSFVLTQKPMFAPTRETFGFQEKETSPVARQQFFGFQDSSPTKNAEQSPFSFGHDYLGLNKRN